MRQSVGLEATARVVELVAQRQGGNLHSDLGKKLRPLEGSLDVMKF